jgi:hypothetical protein
LEGWFPISGGERKKTEGPPQMVWLLWVGCPDVESHIHTFDPLCTCWFNHGEWALIGRI